MDGLESALGDTEEDEMKRFIEEIVRDSRIQQQDPERRDDDSMSTENLKRPGMTENSNAPEVLCLTQLE